MIEVVTLTVTTDPSQIAAVLDRLVEADPVRATVLGSILADVQSGRSTEPWCAVRPGTDALVIRSERQYPALFTSGWDGADLAAAVDLVRGLPGLRGVSGPAEIVEVAATRLARGRPPRRRGLRLFRLDGLRAPTDVPGDARAATGADRSLIVDWYNAFSHEADVLPTDLGEAADHALRSGRVWLWFDGGRPVSLAARRAAQGGSCRLGPVYTPPEHRGQGYGSAVTAAATREVLDLGAIPVLFTDLDNPTSNKIYQRLGYYAVEDRVQVTFG